MGIRVVVWAIVVSAGVQGFIEVPDDGIDPEQIVGNKGKCERIGGAERG